MSHYERLARNPMTYDFGFDNGESEELIILGWLNYLEHSFDLVMIMEHFEESLILLKVLTHAKIFQTHHWPNSTVNNLPQPYQILLKHPRVHPNLPVFPSLTHI